MNERPQPVGPVADSPDNRLDLRLIRVFLAIVDAGGVTAAQATLNIGQSTISTQLATLETRLGYRLCERGRGGFALTARGAQFVDAARTLLSAMNTFGMQARNVGRKLVGTLGIGMIGHTPVSASARISEAIRHMQQRGTTILMTEQMARPALKLATRGYVMRGGEVRRSGSVAEIRDLALAEEYL